MKLWFLIVYVRSLSGLKLLGRRVFSRGLHSDTVQSVPGGNDWHLRESIATAMAVDAREYIPPIVVVLCKDGMSSFAFAGTSWIAVHQNIAFLWVFASKIQQSVSVDGNSFDLKLQSPVFVV